MSFSINGTSGITFNDASVQNTAASGFGFKNRCINGSMMIDQRNAGATSTSISFTVDRWNYQASVATKFTWGRNLNSVTPQAGFTNYLGFQTTTAYSITSNDYFITNQVIEGFNISDLNWGTANAQPVTLSFWVRSSITGTHGGTVICGSGNYPFTYTVSSANTWTQITINVPANTTYTPTSTTNGAGATVLFGLGVGSTYTAAAGSWTTSGGLGANGAVSIVGTLNATWYVTGVQLEKGSTATSFDYRPYGTELQLCQRYYYRNSYSVNGIIGTVQAYNTTGSAFGQLFTHPVPMRATPTSTNSGGTTFQLTNTSSARGATTSVTINPTLQGITLGDSASTGLTTIAGGSSVLYSNTSGTTYIDASAEL